MVKKIKKYYYSLVNYFAFKKVVFLSKNLKLGYRVNIGRKCKFIGNVKIGDRAEHMKKSVAGNISYNRMQELSVSTQKMAIDEDRKQELREKREKKLQVLVDFKAKAAAKREALIASKKR